MRRTVPLITVSVVVTLVLPNAAAMAQQSRVFVTSSTHVGGLGGLNAADAICEQRAQDGSLGGGPWVAWLSTSTVNAVDRLLPGSGPFVRATETGVVIADDIPDLTDGTLDNAILRDENGIPSPGNGPWTGTNPLGLARTTTCQGWTTSSTSELGFVGLETSTSSTWTELFLAVCDQSRRIYCFEASPTPAPTTPAPALAALALLVISGGLLVLRRKRRITG